MYCENCGHRIVENHLFCEECGTKVNSVVLNNSNSSNKTLWIVLSCIFGGFVLFVILGIIFFSFIVINVNETIEEENYNYVDIKEPYIYRDDVIDIEKF